MNPHCTAVIVPLHHGGQTKNSCIYAVHYIVMSDHSNFYNSLFFHFFSIHLFNAISQLSRTDVNLFGSMSFCAK